MDESAENTIGTLYEALNDCDNQALRQTINDWCATGKTLPDLVSQDQDQEFGTIAAELNNAEAIKILHEFNFDFTQQDAYGFLPATVAAGYKSIEALRELNQIDSNLLHQTDQKGKTAESILTAGKNNTSLNDILEPKPTTAEGYAEVSHYINDLDI